MLLILLVACSAPCDDLPSCTIVEPVQFELPELPNTLSWGIGARRIDAVRLAEGGSWVVTLAASGEVPDTIPYPEEPNARSLLVGMDGGEATILAEIGHTGPFGDAQAPYVVRRSLHGRDPAIWLEGRVLTGPLAQTLEATDTDLGEQLQPCGDLTGDGVPERCSATSIEDPVSGERQDVEEMGVYGSLPDPGVVFLTKNEADGTVLCASQGFEPGTTIRREDLRCQGGLAGSAEPFAAHRADDLDGDGATDVALFALDEALVWNPTAGMLARVDGLGGEVGTPPALGDFDGDGDTDLAVPVRATQRGQPGFALHVFDDPLGEVSIAESDVQWVSAAMFDGSSSVTPYATRIDQVLAVDLDDDDGDDELVFRGRVGFEPGFFLVEDPL